MISMSEISLVRENNQVRNKIHVDTCRYTQYMPHVVMLILVAQHLPLFLLQS